MEAKEILDHLAENEAVLTGSHFVYTKGGHGTAYIDMRQIGHQTTFLQRLGVDLGTRLAQYGPDLFIGPETLGRTLATHAGNFLGIDAIWCDIVEVGPDTKVAVFSEKMNFGRLVPGKRLVIVDDLLTTGSSINLTAELVRSYDGEVVAAGAVVRRTPDILAANCGVPELEVLAEVEGFELLSEAECQERGSCAQNVPIVRRPGHGWKYEASNPRYAGGYLDLKI